jgi:hypothetical protein
MENKELLHIAYFAVPHPKPNEQFFYFVSLFSWLMKLNRFQFQRPDQFDDPNTTGVCMSVYVYVCLCMVYYFVFTFSSVKLNQCVCTYLCLCM